MSGSIDNFNGSAVVSLAGSGSAAGGTTGASAVGAIGNDYAELVAHGSNAFAASGAKTLYLEAGDLSLASPAQIGRVVNGVTVTAAMVTQNQQLLDNIAAYCKTNGISVTIEAQLDTPPSGDWTYQWLTPAEQAGLPVTQVDGDDEIEFEHSASDFANVAANEVAIVKQIAHYYPTVTIGQWEGVGPTTTTQQWLSAYDSAAKTASLPQITNLIEDTTWSAPWEIPPSVNQAWELALSTLAAQDHLNLTVVLDGTGTDTSGAEWVAQSEQDAASIAENSGAQVNGLQIQTWWAYPESVLPNNQDSTLSNDAQEISATFSLYQAGLITAQSAVGMTAPAQDVIAVGARSSLSGVALQWSATDLATGATAAVVIIDETGLLSVTDSGGVTVTGSGTNELVIDGKAEDLAAVLASLNVTEPGVGPDVIDIEAFGASGRLADAQVTVLAVPSPAAAAGQTIALPTGGTGQTWTAGTATVGSNGAVSQLLFTWPTSNVNASGAYVVTQEVGIHAPLTEQGVAYVDGLLQAPAANVAGSAPINLNGWGPAGAYDPATTTLTVSLTSTVMSYGTASGKLEQTTSMIAPYAAGSNSSIASLGNYLATGGQQVTEYNTGDNPNWNADWSSLLGSVTTTYGSSGQMLEQVFQGGSSEAWFSLDNVYDPATGELWEQIQTAPPMGQYASFVSGPVFITQFNTGDNPNWDNADWGSADQVTTGWQDTYEVEVTTQAPVLTGATLTAAYNMTGGAVPSPTTAGSASKVTYAAGLTLFGGQNAATITTGGSSILYLPATGPTETVNSGGGDAIWAGSVPTSVTNIGATDALTAHGAQLQLGGTSFNLTGSANALTLNGSTTLNLANATDTVSFGSPGGTLNIGNVGTVAVAGAGGQVNLNGTAAVATIGNGDTVGINGANDKVAVGNNDAVFVNVAGATLQAGNTLQAWTTASNQLVTAGDHATIDEVGAADVLNLGNNGVVWMNGNGETAHLNANGVIDIYGAGDIGTTGSNGNAWIDGLNDQVTAGDDSIVNMVANSNTLTAANSSTIVVTGTLDVVNLTGTGDTIIASNATICTAPGISVNFSLTGTNDVVNGTTIAGADDEAFGFPATPTAPTTAPTLALAPSSDSGAVGDGITNVTQPELAGTAPAGDTVAITSNNTVAGTVTATAAGLWTYTFAGSLANGSYILQATATDPVSGTTTTSSDYMLQIDATPPASPIIAGVNGAVTNNGTSAVSNSHPTITGTGPDGDLITVLDNGVVLATTTAAADGAWSLQPPAGLTSSNNTLTAKATDVAGNVSTQSAPLVESTSQLQTLSINLPSALAEAATPALQQAIGSSWSNNSPINVTAYTPGNTPPSAAAGTVLALLVGDANDNQVVATPAGTNVVYDTADGAVTLAGGGSNQLFLAAGNGTTTFVSNGGSGVYLANQAAGAATNGNSLVIITNGANGSTGNYVVDTSSGTNVIQALAGNDTIAGGTGADTVNLGAGNDLIYANGTDFISCDSVAGGSDTVNAGTDPNTVSVWANQSNLTFLGGSGQSVIVGGTLPMDVLGWAGSDTIWGSSGGGQYWGGQAGNNYVEAGTSAGACTLVGGNGDNNGLFAANSANDELVAGGGNETLGGADATGNNQFFSGAGNTVILAGHGDDTVSMCAGNSTVFAGANTLTFADSPGFVVASSGNQTITGGGSSEVYLFQSNLGGGNTIIDNFNPSQDQVTFCGYSARDISTALAAQTNSAGNTFVTLSDNTRIAFMGLQSLNSSSVSSV